jgi:macrolide transport system ATP-binding/permease protein
MMNAGAVPPAKPLIELRDIRKTYTTEGGVTVEALRGISLTIRRGEFAAIVGASGSGKSTLMNIVGLLDRQTEGDYLFSGQDTTRLDIDARARRRRDAFGFVFQQYNLIAADSALENVELPAIYAGQASDTRRGRAKALLRRLGLGDRLNHRPSQLSGGEQQRVATARALINGGEVILADEPTGALDSIAGRETMGLLQELATEGHTVIVITHDSAIANLANRVIELADGRIVSDSGSQPLAVTTLARTVARAGGSPWLADIGEAFKAARRALATDRLRTGLTLLGIIIGVASVIGLMAIGEGSRQSVLDQLSVFGTHRLYVSPGNESGHGLGGTLSAEDAELVREIPNVSAAMPYLQGQVTARFGNVDVRTTATAVTTDFPRILSWPIGKGQFFTKADERSLATVAVLGRKVADELFQGGTDPVARFILINNVPFQVIGVLSAKGAISGDADDDDTIVIPFPTGSRRIFGTPNLSWISVQIDDIHRSDQTVQDITSLLAAKHRVLDFDVYNRAAGIEAQGRAANVFTILLGMTAAISLLVGGIGVMNVMLISVTERTREIGIRMATGAGRLDILYQFLAEALMLSAVGGFVGLVSGHLVGLIVAVAGVRVIFTLHAALAALSCGIFAGLIFGFIPARRAALLEPVAALARE